MAQRRMFSLKIVSSDSFLEMPTSSRELYFQLGMYADDDGFVNPRKIMRMVGSSDDDLKVLIGKRFILPFENGVVVIKHWLINNLIRKDFYQETMYVEQKKTLQIKENKGYTEIVNNLLPQYRIGKDSIGKDRLDTMSAIADASEPINDSFSIFWNAYPKKELKKKAQEIWNRRKLGIYLQEILSFIEKAKQTDRWKKGYIKQPTVFLNNDAWTDDISGFNDKGKTNSNVLQANQGKYENI